MSLPSQSSSSSSLPFCVERFHAHSYWTPKTRDKVSIPTSTPDGGFLEYSRGGSKVYGWMPYEWMPFGDYLKRKLNIRFYVNVTAIFDEIKASLALENPRSLVRSVADDFQSNMHNTWHLFQKSHGHAHII